MRILVIGAGGVGSAVVGIAARRSFFEHVVVADYDDARVAKALAQVAGDPRFSGARVDASDVAAMVALIRANAITHVLNAVDPRFVMPVFDACLAAGVDYMDMAMSLSKPHPQRPYELAGEKYAADHLFSEIDEVGIRDGANLVVDGYDFAPSFSIWTTIEECLNPPAIYEADRGWYTTAPFSEPEVFDFPEGIGPVECVNVEHEEVLLVPRGIKAKRVTFKYGLGNEFIGVLRTLHMLGLDRTAPVRVKGVEVSPRDVVAALLPDPAGLGDRMHGKTCAGTWVTGRGVDGAKRAVYLYHVVDSDWSWREYGAQAVVWQTAINPVVALELLAAGTWSGTGVLGPEAFDAVPFLELLTAYGSPWGMREETIA